MSYFVAFEILEIRSAIEDNAKDFEKLRKLLSQNEDVMNRQVSFCITSAHYLCFEYEQLVALFRDKNFAEAKEVVHRITYYEKIQSELKQKLPVNA